MGRVTSCRVVGHQQLGGAACVRVAPAEIRRGSRSRSTRGGDWAPAGHVGGTRRPGQRPPDSGCPRMDGHQAAAPPPPPPPRCASYACNRMHTCVAPTGCSVVPPGLTGSITSGAAALRLGIACTCKLRMRSVEETAATSYGCDRLRKPQPQSQR